MIDVERAMRVSVPADLDRWLRVEGATATEVVVAIIKRSTGAATVTLLELQEVALCHGWVDTQTKRIDERWYAIRFVPRRPRSTWGPKNRAMARRLRDAGRIEPAGLRTLPPDLG
ncbi:MAG: hypothetical protein U0869_21615 [Chloroflexota bacterium]